MLEGLSASPSAESAMEVGVDGRGWKQKSAPDIGLISAIELRERGRWTRLRDSRAQKKGGQ